PDAVRGIREQEWIEVEGQVQFRKWQNRDGYAAVLVLPSLDKIHKTSPGKAISFPGPRGAWLGIRRWGMGNGENEFQPLQEAVAFAARAHRNQLRKDKETPYVSHVFRVCLI